MAVTASTWQPLRGDKRWAYLARARTIRVATANEDGSIYLSPLWLVVHEKKLYIPIDAASRHAANFTAGRPLSALVDQGEEYATVSGVRVMGRMQEVSDPALVETLAGLVVDKYFHVGHPYLEQYLEFGAVAGRRYFELVPDKMIGWDMREINVLPMPEARTLPAHVGDRLV
ncbi:pyridoxamine 5'-phosphate oxidase family protein [Pseudonocardia sp.]|uniref:pyridoxamine 5'-phosphate oxidase family protein n=1 Tax=Pseudonocardia sp. TaxID=60912 RepID=UPI00260B03E9|nr:pyridoxamine 5'-phosphate oxidase family protein [Pseudonocardia sp.]